jgi:hypothetical protein
MPNIRYKDVPFPLYGGIETKVADLMVQPPKLLVAEHCFSARSGSLRRRRALSTLTNLTVDGGTIATIAGGGNMAAVALYKKRLLAFDLPSIAAGVYQYSEQAARWTEHGTYAPGVIQGENISASGGGQLIEQAESDVCGNYTLTAQVEDGPDDSGVLNSTVRVSLQDLNGVFICHRMQIFTNNTGVFTGGALNLRVTHFGSQFYVFFADDANHDLKVWLLDVTSPATITTALNASGGGSAAAPVTVASDLSAIAGLAVFDVAPSLGNGIFVAYKTTTVNQLKLGFVNAVGVLASTTTLATAAGVISVAVAVSATANPATRHGVTYITGIAGADVYAVHLSWNGAAWAVTATSAAIDAFVGDPAVSVACRYDSSTVLRIWYTADRTTGVAAADTSRYVTYQSTYTTAGVVAARVLRLRRAALASRPFQAADGKLYYWVIVGRRSVPSSSVQTSHFLIESATGLPVAATNINVALSPIQAPVTVADRSPAMLASLPYLTQAVDGSSFQQNVGVRNVSWSLVHEQSHKVVEAGDCLYLAGGLMQQFDGNSFVEAGFLRFVESDTIGVAQSTVGGTRLTLLGKYYVRVIPETYNARGERDLGTDTGPVATFTLTGGNDTLTYTVPTITMTRKRRTNSVVSSHQTARDNVVFGIYRTAVNPTSTAAPFYRVGQVTNDPTVDQVTFVDGTPDSEITDNEQLYLGSGEQSHTIAPIAHIMCEGSGRVFMAGDTERQQAVFFSLLRQPGDPLAFNLAMSIIMPDHGGAITALAVMNEALVVFKERAIYRVRGPGPDNTLATGSFFEPELIVNDIGCEGQRSVVVTPLGIMFKSARGFQLLDPGYQVEYIGAPLEGLVGNDNPNASGSPITGAVLLPMDQQVRFNGASVWVYDYWNKVWSLFSNAGLFSGPSVEWNGIATGVAAAGIQYEDDAATYGLGQMRLVLALLKGQSAQEDLHVRRVAVTGTVDNDVAGFTVKLYANRKAAVAQTNVFAARPVGPVDEQFRTVDAARIVSTLKVEILDNNESTTGILTLNEVIFEVGSRGEGLSARVAP